MNLKKNVSIEREEKKGLLIGKPTSKLPLLEGGIVMYAEESG